MACPGVPALGAAFRGRDRRSHAVCVREGASFQRAMRVPAPSRPFGHAPARIDRAINKTM